MCTGVLNFEAYIEMFSLLAIIALLAVQSFPWLLIHNAILFINTSTMLDTREVIG